MGLRKDSRSHAPAWECGADAPASLQYTEKADHSQKTGRWSVQFMFPRWSVGTRVIG